jgi:hypothetical protein
MAKHFLPIKLNPESGEAFIRNNQWSIILCYAMELSFYQVVGLLRQI